MQLDLIDDDSIMGGGIPLGGSGLNNGSFQGQTYNILQTYPKSYPSIARRLQRADQRQQRHLYGDVQRTGHRRRSQRFPVAETGTVARR